MAWRPLVARVADRFFEGRTLMAAHMELPRSAVIGVVDAIRNRVLQFVLEIEEQAPDVGEAKPGGAAPLPADQVTQIFNTTIMGAANVAVGGQNVSQSAQVVAGDLESLRKYLANLGLPGPDVADLETALKQDAPPNKEGQFGPNVAGWMGKMVKKAAEGGWKIAVPTAATVLASAIRWYHGLP
jgi:AbiTii